MIHKKFPKVQLTTDMVSKFKERYGFVSESADRVMANFPVKGRPQEFDVTGELREACKSVVPGILDSIADLIATYDPELRETIRSNVLLAGGRSQMISLPRLIEAAMDELGGGKVTRVEEPLFAGSNAALKMAQRMPRHFWQALA
jgi:rod shape-determining protein MreB